MSNIITLKINDIVLDKEIQPRRELDKTAIERYVESYDNLPPVIVFDTERGKLLVDGWHRRAAAKRKGLDEIKVDLRDGSYRDAIKYAVEANARHGIPLSLTEKKAAARKLLKLDPLDSDTALADVTGLSQPTIGNLRTELENQGQIPVTIGKGGRGIARRELQLEKPVKFTGFSEDSESTDQPDTEEKPEPPPDPWAGKVIQADAFEYASDIQQEFDCVFLDPPYGLGVDEWDPIVSDAKLVAEYRKWVDLAISHLKPDGRLFICCAQWRLFALQPLIAEMMEIYPLHFGNLLIWHYPNTMSQPSNRKMFKYNYEPILYWYGLDAGEPNWSVYGEEQGEVWQVERDSVFNAATPQSNFNEDKKYHPAQKPIKLLERIIAISVPVGGAVLDPCCGSGTTAVAAHKLGRDFLVIDRESEYIAITRRRLDKVV